jgi:anti-anti-sigma regulatory factor
MTSTPTVPPQLLAQQPSEPLVLGERPVTTVTLNDGMVVVLRGALDRMSAPVVRAALMVDRPAGCNDIVIDAGGVTAADGAGLAALLAAETWAFATGARLRYTRVSDVLSESLGTVGLLTLVPDPDADPAGHRAETA